MISCISTRLLLNQNLTIEFMQWLVSTKISVSEEKTQCSSPVVVIFHFSSSHKNKTVLRSNRCEWVNEWVNTTQQIYTLH